MGVFSWLPSSVGTGRDHMGIKTFAMWVRLVATLMALTPTIALAAEPTAREQRTIAEVVGKHLKDPYSAKFEWLPFSGEQPLVYCALVNAKNSYGAYTGRRPFELWLLWDNGTIGNASAVRIGDSDEDRTAVESDCAMHGYKM